MKFNFLSLKTKAVKAFPAALRKKLPKDVGIVEVTSQESRKLNRIYRNKDRATNVLSFAYGPDYGELLICLPVIRREAKEQGHAFDYQVTWMIVHGIIHLAGLHHEKSRAAEQRVERLEKEILADFFPHRGYFRITNQGL